MLLSWVVVHPPRVGEALVLGAIRHVIFFFLQMQYVKNILASFF